VNDNASGATNKEQQEQGSNIDLHGASESGGGDRIETKHS
jgi:hypothetical protein